MFPDPRGQPIRQGWPPHNPLGQGGAMRGAAHELVKPPFHPSRDNNDNEETADRQKALAGKLCFPVGLFGLSYASYHKFFCHGATFCENFYFLSKKSQILAMMMAAAMMTIQAKIPAIGFASQNSMYFILHIPPLRE